MVLENFKRIAPKKNTLYLNFKILTSTVVFDFSMAYNSTFLKLSPAVRCIHAKKRGIPIPSGLGLEVHNIFKANQTFKP